MPLDRWLEMLACAARTARDYDALVAGSITVANPEPAAKLAAAMEQAGLRWVELNLSAPHGREAAGGAIRQVSEAESVRNYVARVRAATSLPLAVKLTSQTADPLALASSALAAGADI